MGAFQSAAVETGMAVLGAATGGVAYAAFRAYKAAKAVKKLKKLKEANVICKLACFVAGTQVLTKDGYVDIEALQVGDEVWATDIKTGESDFKSVTKTWTVEGEAIHRVTITNEQGDVQTIDATDSHPFYVVGSGWIETIDLKPGDTLVDKDQGFLIVESVVDQHRIETAYNLTVADFHTYYVTERNVLVHNCKEFDVVSYRPTSTPLVNHHGVNDVWAKNNIPGYTSRKADNPTIALESTSHKAAHRAGNDYLRETLGSVRGQAKNLTPRQMQQMAERQFDAANVPQQARQNFYNEFNKYIYGL